MVKGVLFDFWGTLAENGIYPSPVKQVKFILRIRMPFKDYIVKLEEVMMTRQYDDLNEAFKAVCEEFRVHYSPYLIEKLVGMWNKNELLGKPFPETIEILEYLKENNIKVGLISNTTSTIKRVLDKYDLNKYFDASMLSYEEGLLKSDPEMFHKLIDKMGLDSEDVIMVGDSVPSDIIGARKAGLKAILIDRKEKQEYGAKITSLKKIKELIENDEIDQFASVSQAKTAGESADESES